MFNFLYYFFPEVGMNMKPSYMATYEMDSESGENIIKENVM